MEKQYRKSIITIFLTSFSIILLFVSFFQGRKYILIRKWKRLQYESTLGEVKSIKYGGKGSKHSEIQYVVRKDTFRVKAPSKLPIGSILKVSFNIDKPSEAFVSSDAPISIKKKKTGLKIAKITDHKTFGVDFYNYEYWVNNKKYKGVYIPSLTSENTLLRVGNYYQIKFLIDSHQISKLLVGKKMYPSSDWYLYRYDSIKGFYK